MRRNESRQVRAPVAQQAALPNKVWASPCFPPRSPQEAVNTHERLKPSSASRNAQGLNSFGRGIGDELALHKFLPPDRLPKRLASRPLALRLDIRLAVTGAVRRSLRR